MFKTVQIRPVGNVGGADRRQRRVGRELIDGQHPLAGGPIMDRGQDREEPTAQRLGNPATELLGNHFAPPDSFPSDRR